MLESNMFAEFPEVYTKETIPVSRHNIPLQRDIEKWDYLSTMKIPELDADVEPYALRTPIGWVINSLL